MHLQRWLTSLIALPLLLYIILWGPPLIFLLLLVLISSAAHWEYLTICGLGQTPTARALGLGLGLIVLLGFFSDQPYLPGFCLTAGMLVYFLFFLLKFEEFPHLLPELALSCLGLCYVPFLVGHFYWLWQAPPDRLWLLWLLAVIFAGDTGAFYFGRWFGVRKLYPLVSPGKTVAGALGGLAASLTIGLGLGLWLPLGVALPMLTGLTLVAALVGQFGDLFESMLKRRAQVKDASSILPGHGGMLDRLDSLSFTAAVLFYLRILLP